MKRFVICFVIPFLIAFALTYVALSASRSGQRSLTQAELGEERKRVLASARRNVVEPSTSTPIEERVPSAAPVFETTCPPSRMSNGDSSPPTEPSPYGDGYNVPAMKIEPITTTTNWTRRGNEAKLIHPASCFPPNPSLETARCGIVINAALPYLLSDESREKAEAKIGEHVKTQLKRMESIDYVMGFPVVVVTPYELGIPQEVLPPHYRITKLERPKTTAEAAIQAQPFSALKARSFERTLYVNMSVRIDERTKNPVPTLYFRLCDHFDVLLQPAPHGDVLLSPRAAVTKATKRYGNALASFTPIDPVYSTTLLLLRTTPATKSWLHLWEQRFAEALTAEQTAGCAGDSSLGDSLRETSVRVMSLPSTICHNHNVGDRQDMCAVIRGPKRDREQGARCDYHVWL